MASHLVGLSTTTQSDEENQFLCYRAITRRNTRRRPRTIKDLWLPTCSPGKIVWPRLRKFDLTCNSSISRFVWLSHPFWREFQGKPSVNRLTRKTSLDRACTLHFSRSRLELCHVCPSSSEPTWVSHGKHLIIPSEPQA